MTREKLQFLLPVVFTVGPDVNKRGQNAKGSKEDDILEHARDEILDSHAIDNSVGSPEEAGTSATHAGQNRPRVHSEHEEHGDALMKYAMLLADSSKKASGKQHIENIVKGIIEGETRVLVSSMTMEEIFTEVRSPTVKFYLYGKLNEYTLSSQGIA